MVTLKDIAREAGVTVGTVSDVLRTDDPRYNPATRKQIRQTAERLGYRPNRLAQAMVRGRSHMLGLVGYHLGTLVTMQKVDAIVTEAQKHGYELLLTGRRETADPAAEREFIENLLARRVDGLVILIESECDLAYYRQLRQQKVPLVMVGYHSRPGRLPLVSVHAEEGMYQMTRHLLTLGHRDFALVLGAYTAALPHNRLDGCVRALRERGLNLREGRVFRQGLIHFRAAHEFTKRLMRSKPYPTAIIYNNDEMAQAGILALREMGFEIPRDVSVVGYDDLPSAAYTCPPLTTVRQPRQELAKAVVRLLMRQIQGQGLDGTGCIRLTPKLIIRRSSGPAPRST